MKNLLIRIACITFIIATAIFSSCHKISSAVAPPTPQTIDSTAYNDSVKHYQDSVQHYQDSVQRTDSLNNYYFDRIIGPWHWDGTGVGYAGNGSSRQYTYTDTVLSVSRSNPNIGKISVKVGDMIFPQDSLRISVNGNVIVYSSNYERDIFYTLTYYTDKDSLAYDYYHRIFHGYFSMRLHTRR